MTPASRTEAANYQHSEHLPGPPHSWYDNYLGARDLRLVSYS
jgi:hypothetical protein